MQSSIVVWSTNTDGWTWVPVFFLLSSMLHFYGHSWSNWWTFRISSKHIWEMYYNGLNGKVGDMVRLPFIPEYATNNGHMFYLLCPSLEYRIALMTYLKENDVQTTFHYLPLHSSKYYADKYYGAELPNCDYYSDCLVRLPLYYELTDLEVKKIIKHIIEFCSKN